MLEAGDLDLLASCLGLGCSSHRAWVWAVLNNIIPLTNIRATHDARDSKFMRVSAGFLCLLSEKPKQGWWVG